jgi:hypothetical protein
LTDNSFALGFLVGILIIIGPQLTLYILKLRRQVGFLQGNTTETGESGETYDKEFPNRKERS